MRLSAPCLAPLAAAALLAAQPAPAAAPKRPAGRTLRIHDLSFDPLAPPRPVARPSVPAAPAIPAAPSRYSLVQYDPGAGQRVADAIRAASGTIYGPVVHDGLLVGGLTVARLKAIKGVRFAGPYLPEYKLSPPLRAERAPDEALTLAVTVFRDAAGTAAQIEKLGGKARRLRPGPQGQVLEVVIPAKLLDGVAALPEVRHLEPGVKPLKKIDNAPVLVGVRATAHPPWANFQGLDGNGEILGVYDSGGDTGNPNTLIQALRGRLTGDVAGWSNQTLQPTWADLDYAGNPEWHGTSVLDIAVGSGAGSAGGLLTGVAPAARAIIRPMNADSNGLTPGYLDLDLALTNAWNAGARVHNDSWDPATGTWPNLVGLFNVYTQQGSAVLDLFVQQNPDMLVVTSGSNDGPNANTIGTLSCAKNSLSVANSGNGNPPTGAAPPPAQYAGIATNQIDNSSSRGPTPAGQLKPDVSAPGTMVAAACSQGAMGAHLCPDNAAAPPYLNQPGYAYGIGTSFAAPMVSGTALLVHQFFEREGLTPSGMLVKATLMNGAGQLYNYAPDDSQGWGRINLATSLVGPAGNGKIAWYDSFHAPGARFAFHNVGQSVSFEGLQFTQGQPLAVTLVWFDYLDAAYSGALVNDLDLTLTDGHTVYHGGVPSMHNGVTVAGGGPDTINASEKIYLAAAPAGTWTITVTASEMAPDSPQYFAVVVMSLENQSGVSDLLQTRRQ